MYQILFTKRMKKDMRLIKRRGKDIQKLTNILELLASGKTLSPRNRDHALAGQMQGLRECHIEPDWLLIYRIEERELILIATATGTHADLFGL